jgi:hypothetical protein
MRGVLGLLFGLGPARGAHAGGRPPGRTEPLDIETKVETESYRATTLAVDGLVYLGGLVVLSAVADDDNETQFWTATGLYLGAYADAVPYVHWSQGNRTEAGASLGLRVGLPAIAGYALYEAAGGDCSDECDSDLAAVGGVALGMLGAVVLDLALLPKKQVTRTYVYRYALTPSVQVTDDRVSLSLGGSF